MQKIVCESGLQFQIGGGLRTFDRAKTLLQLGARRVVIGSAAVSDPEMVCELLSRFGPEAVTISIDVRIDESGAARIAIDGWKNQTVISSGDVLSLFLEKGLRHVLCTDISRDGMMKGPNLDLYRSLKSQFPNLEIQASGGVSCLGDLLTLKEAGLSSAVVGRAIYEGALNLVDAVQVC